MDGTETRFAFEVTPQRQHISAGTRHTRRAIWVIFLVLGILVLAVAAEAKRIDRNTSPTVMLLWGWLAASFGVLLPWLASRALVKTTLKRAGRLTSYRIDSDGIWTANDLVEGLVRWPMVKAVVDTPSVTLVKLDGALVMPIVTEYLTEGRRSALVAYIRQHAASSAGAGGSRAGTT